MKTQGGASQAPRPLALALTAFSMGLLGDLLFYPGLLGVNVFVWAAGLALAVLVLAWATGTTLRGEGRWLLAPALLFAGFVAWRSSPVLQAINVGVVVALFAIAAFRLREGRIRLAGVTEYFWLAMLSGVALIVGAFEALVRDLDWRHWWRSSGGSRTLPVVRGLVVATPVFVLFAALFASADAVFSSELGAALSFDASSAVAHVGRALLWMWIAEGFLHGALVEEPEALPEVQPAAAMRLGPIEVGTILGLLDILFLAFVAIQVRYLFGGEGHVQVTEGLTYAEYARHGFFELLAVAALVLPVVLVIHWLLRDSSPVLRIGFRFLAAGLVVFLYVVIASALRRMQVYVEEFGLTELRVYTTAIMVWLATVFGWLMLTVLRERRKQFAFGSLASGLLVVAGLNVINPDAFIVNTNLDRVDDREFDTAYAGGLSPDATPAVIAALPELPARTRCEVAKAIEKREFDSGGWQAWNYGRTRARETISSHEAVLAAACASE